jgi:hypothetical protein
VGAQADQRRQHQGQLHAWQDDRDQQDQRAHPFEALQGELDRPGFDARQLEAAIGGDFQERRDEGVGVEQHAG